MHEQNLRECVHTICGNYTANKITHTVLEHVQYKREHTETVQLRGVSLFVEIFYMAYLYSL